MAELVTIDEYRLQVAKQMSENALQDQIEALAFDLGWKTYHTHDSRRSNPGWPDLALVHPKRGRFMVRELKKHTGRVSKEQREWLDALTGAGVDAGVWRPMDMIDKTVERELSA